MKPTTHVLAAALPALSALTVPVGAATFGDDLAFLRQHQTVIELTDPSGQARVAVVPAWQGRVMTSTAAGAEGTSYGWVNRELIASGKTVPHINVYGGEDRFWLGPEGGQYSVFFAPGATFDLEHWFTPASVDTEPFEVAGRSTDRVAFHRSIRLMNYSGTTFDLEVVRQISLLKAPDALAALGLTLPQDVAAVAFESSNAVRNAGTKAWTKDGGLLSIWILGMFNASPVSTVVVPYVTGPESERGPVVNDAYFGKVPADRLVTREGQIFFRADAAHRGKIGLSPRRAKSLLGSYDAANHTLTLVHFTLPKGASDYVNSMWEIQKEPFAGDVVNSYNDGAPQPGAKQLGKFYELETSSPALALEPGARATHVHQTIHLQGPEAALDAISRQALGVGVREIAGVFAR
jgi:hypothetical protein